MQEPLPTAPEEMLTYFGGWDDSEAALNKGDTAAGQNAGEVLDAHCPHFNDFVKWGKDNGSQYSQKDLDDYNIPINLKLTPLSIPALTFEVALRKYFRKEILSDFEVVVLNGTIIAEADLQSSMIGTGSDNRLFVIPGYDVMLGERNLKDPLWSGVKHTVNDALAKNGSRLINLSGAVQLRLGSESSSTFNPIVVAPGFTIKGGM